MVHLLAHLSDVVQRPAQTISLDECSEPLVKSPQRRLINAQLSGDLRLRLLLVVTIALFEVQLLRLQHRLGLAILQRGSDRLVLALDGRRLLGHR